MPIVKQDGKIINAISNIALFLLLIHTMPLTAAADQSQKTNAAAHSCDVSDYPCMLTELHDAAQNVNDVKWRDKLYREIAKLYTITQDSASALAVLDQIQSADTKALAIRGIGFAAADHGYSPAALNTLFTKLHEKAKTIEAQASREIALTYIAMPQARAALDQDALITANMIQTDALRNKAHAENAEIQAERGDLDAAARSIAEIDDAAFKDRAYRLVSKIFTQQKNFEKAQHAAYKIENDYDRANALLELMAKQIVPEEVSVIK